MHKILVCKGRDIVFIEISAFDINVGEGIDSWVRYKGIGNGGESNLFIFIKC